MYRQVLTDPNLDPAVRALIEEQVTLGKGKDRRQVKRPAMDDSYEVLSNKGDRDAAELPVAADEPDFREKIDSQGDELAERFDLLPGQRDGIMEWHAEQMRLHGDREVAIRLARLASFMFREENLKQTLYALMFATWTASANGLTSMRKACMEIPKPHGGHVTVASLSKVANRLCSYLGLPPGEGMKSNASVQVYSDTQKEVHKRLHSERQKKAISSFGGE